MTIENMCVKEGLYFRDSLAGHHYCKLSYSGGKVKCKYFGSKDESLLHVCDYDKIDGEKNE